VPSAGSTPMAGQARFATSPPRRTVRVPLTGTKRRLLPSRAAIPASRAARDTKVTDTDAGVSP
jgi:hypothetical protein